MPLMPSRLGYSDGEEEDAAQKGEIEWTRRIADAVVVVVFVVVVSGGGGGGRSTAGSAFPSSCPFVIQKNEHEDRGNSDEQERNLPRDQNALHPC